MLDGVMLLWFFLVALSLVFVTVDIRATPDSAVMKWGFVLLTAYTGPIGAFLYVLGCREPLQGLHEQYVAVRWRQALGSTMHCVAGDGVGILVGAVLARYFHIEGLAEIALEYALGFMFGWTVFQALFMRDMAGSYGRSLRTTFVPEFLSMNILMAGMVPVAALFVRYFDASLDPLQPEFWFRMSMALLAGFIVALPMNWWLVARHLKHGMTTVRSAPLTAKVPEPIKLAATCAHPARSAAGESTKAAIRGMSARTVPQVVLLGMMILSLTVFAFGLALAEWLATLQ
ncbi:DUF4396 domain-containing protein [Pusillimonas sp. ANT_WB101]|uniref:DUF4396 domain-containing protein n=1 Tax=Pusillimonas sp. ANT_WB101 TaxID=2597356 RepID=UPI0011EFF79A|nr:DUF4396 domain-containing protein [Pusillimonas sp. ANT_WB101]KAA0889342.1 DUF4396 domain-containing protein [Pusillimonas sp. ANT_WB101]